MTVLADALATGSTLTPAGIRVPLQDHISAEEGAFLQSLVREVRASHTLEVGLAYGISALHICEALAKTPTTQHIVIDPYQHHFPNPSPHLTEAGFQGAGLHALTRAGFKDLIDFWEMPSYLALPQLVAQHREIEFAFIDGMHTLDYALVDFFYIDKLLTVGGVVCFDDADYPALRKLCRYIATNCAYTVMPSPLRDTPGRMLRRLRPLIPERIGKPELTQPDEMLGLHGSCIAFRKIAQDTRAWDFHRLF